jgi:hypothetical protein
MVTRKTFKTNVLGAVLVDRHIVALTERDTNVSLSLLNDSLANVNNVVCLKGKNGFILDVKREEFLISVDDGLVLVRDGSPELLLRASRPENVFWHAIEARGEILVQEYGEPPTGIYKLGLFGDCRRLITNSQIDKSSRHFHDIVYDPYRNWLIATMGDSRLIRVVFSEDFGETWKPLLRDPIQFVPIVALKDRLLFGMDSSIFKGGVGIYHPIKDEWEFVFLKWLDTKVRFAQMSGLRQLSNGFWTAALGTPQAIVFSTDLETWYCLHAEGFDERFNHHMSISEENDLILCAGGNSLLLLEKNELEPLSEKNQPAMIRYHPYIDKLKSYRFLLKRKLFVR